MCFSAPASFIASGGLIALGGVSLVVAKKEDKILAAIPLLFGIQQALEGIQWLYLNNGSSSLSAGYGFLIFTFIVWPIYVPSFVFLLDKKKRKILKWFIFLGIVVSLYSLLLLSTESVGINEFRACVNYTLNSPSPYVLLLGNFLTVAYLLATVGPLLISSRRIFKWFGVAILILAIISWFFFNIVFISVWCFFAAIVSSMFFVYIIKDKQNSKK